MSLTKIVSLSERCFSSHAEVNIVELSTLKPNLSIRSFASIILDRAPVKGALSRILTDF